MCFIIRRNNWPCPGIGSDHKSSQHFKRQEGDNFFIVGDGPEKDRLIKLSNTQYPGNTRFISNMPGDKIPELVAACDAYIVPLKRNDLFKGAIPSKLFEPLAMGKPILLGVEGEAKKLFIEEGKCGIAFEPENEMQLSKCIQLLLDDRRLVSELGANGKAYILKNFDRKVINKYFYKRIQSI